MKKNVLSKILCLAAAIAILAGNTAAASSGGVFSEVDNDGLLRISADTAGYSFDGWYTNDSFTGSKYNPGGAITPSGDTDLYARWLCDLKWDLNGGTGGSAKNTTFYEDQGTTVTEPATPPTQTGMEFTGWYKDSGCKDKVTFPYNVTKPTTIYAGWEKSETYTVKYAVCIWGIDQDTYQNGGTDKAGLTFGPATGANYVNTFKQHSAGKDCLHNMTWAEIIAQSQKNPHYFDECLANGCTHSVCINITGALKGTDYSGKMDDGDGGGILYYSIASSYRKWNSGRSNAGGWPASRMRATLNGKDNQTDSSVAGDDCLDKNACLLAMFPEDLQKGIVAKAVKSDTVYNDLSGSNVTTYDKLWLFSGREIRKYEGTDATGTGDVRPNEGELYQRSENLGITTSVYGDLRNYADYGYSVCWWLRSAVRNISNYAYYVSTNGDCSFNNANNANNGFALGFCLK